MEKILTIAIPTFNRSKLLKRTLETLYSQLTDDVEILVSDNASTDDTTEMIITYFPKVKYYRNEKNIGPDKNFLQCYKLATGKYIWLLGDDDIVFDKAIDKVVAVLKKEAVSLLTMNYVSFAGDYDLGKCTKPYFDTNNDILITTDKDRYISVVKHHLTFISCFIIDKDVFKNVKDPSNYEDTYFIHTGIVFEGTRRDGCRLAVLFEPLLAQDLSPGSALVNQNVGVNFYIFGNRARNILCNVATNFGYSTKHMKKVLSEWICPMFMRSIISMKARNVNGWEENYIKYGYEAVKDLPLAYITVIPAYYMPKFIAKLIYGVGRLRK